MKRVHHDWVFEKYPNEYVLTGFGSGRLVAHSASIRKLLAEAKRRRIDLTKTLLQRTPPDDAVCIY